VCDLDVTGTPSIIKIIRSVTILPRMLSHFSFIKTRQNSLYESIKRELKTRPVNESRYDERLKLKLIYTTRIHWVTRGTGTPKDKDELNKREVYECDG
jgi:hypothetical protein